MAEKNKGKLFIILALLGIVLIPLLKAKPPELGGKITSTEFTRIIK